MKSLRFALLAVLLAGSSFAQISTVTATVPAFSNGTAVATFVNGGGGTPSPTVVIQPINNAGFFRMSLAPNTAPAFAPSTWSVQICAQAPSLQPTCYTQSVSIIQSTQDITQSFAGAPTVIALSGYQPSGSNSLPIILGSNLSLNGNTLNATDGDGAVASVNGQTGTVVLTASDVGAIPQSFLSGATSRFDMLPAHISGTTLEDQSGSGNNGTFGATAPTSTATGLTFSIASGVSLPAALNSTRTFLASIYIPPLPSNNQGYTVGYNSLLAPSQGSAGYAFLDNYAANNTFYGAGDIFAPSSFAAGQFAAACNTLVSGYHVFAVTLGTNTTTDPDVLYIDGQPCAAYTHAASASAGLMSTGNYFLGAAALNTFANNGFVGTMFFAETFSTELTPSSIATESTAISNSVASRGVPLTPVPLNLGLPQVTATGDSITFGEGVGMGAAWPAQLVLTNQPTYTIQNLGIEGITLQAIDGSVPNREDLQCPNVGGPSIDIIFAGTNDLVGGTTPQAALAYLAGAVQSVKKSGCIVGVGTMLSRNGYDTQKDTYDALIVSNWQYIGADFLVDFAANPLLGADGASLNPNATGCSGGPTFQGDATHPTACGQLLLAAEASNALNYHYGYNLSTPHVVATNTYQMLAGDGAVIAAPTGTAAYTLPECAGQSGAVYTINNPQSTHTLSIVGLTNAEPINGQTTALTIPSNSTVVLRDVANPKATAGCQWVM